MKNIFYKNCSLHKIINSILYLIYILSNGNKKALHVVTSFLNTKHVNIYRYIINYNMIYREFLLS